MQCNLSSLSNLSDGSPILTKNLPKNLPCGAAGQKHSIIGVTTLAYLHGLEREGSYHKNKPLELAVLLVYLPLSSCWHALIEASDRGVNTSDLDDHW